MKKIAKQTRRSLELKAEIIVALDRRALIDVVGGSLSFRIACSPTLKDSTGG